MYVDSLPHVIVVTPESRQPVCTSIACLVLSSHWWNCVFQERKTANQDQWNPAVFGTATCLTLCQLTRFNAQLIAGKRLSVVQC